MVNINAYGLVGLVAGAAVVAGLVTFLVARRGREDTTEDPTVPLDAAIARLQGELGAQVRSLDEKVAGLSNIFTNDRTRGTWGELTLRRVLEQAGLRPDDDFELQVTGDNGRPDAVVHLPGGRKLIIDAKFPIARLTEALAAEDDETRTALMKAHAADVLKDAKALVGRGYQQHAVGGFVVMYLPHEGMYVQAMEAMPDLYDTLLGMRVILAGPSTLLALLSAAGHVIAEQRIVSTAREIVDEAKELRSRLATFTTHLAKLGRGLGSAVTAYNSSVGSWTSRVGPQADKVAHHAGLQALDAIKQIDAAPRVLEPEPEVVPFKVAG